MAAGVILFERYTRASRTHTRARSRVRAALGGRVARRLGRRRHFEPRARAALGLSYSAREQIYAYTYVIIMRLR